jgi:hypothetical protein
VCNRRTPVTSDPRPREAANPSGGRLADYENTAESTLSASVILRRRRQDVFQSSPNSLAVSRPHCCQSMAHAGPDEGLAQQLYILRGRGADCITRFAMFCQRRAFPDSETYKLNVMGQTPGCKKSVPEESYQSSYSRAEGQTGVEVCNNNHQEGSGYLDSHPQILYTFVGIIT